jgi:excinuclease UvrABC nuclease subunit
MLEVVVKYTVYRFYDANLVLLYVGYSQDPKGRFDAHMSSTEWSSEIKSVFIEMFDDQKSALLHEKNTIKELVPKYNKTYRFPREEIDSVMAIQTIKQLIRYFGSQSRAAEELGYTRAAVSQWVKKGELPRNVQKHFASYRMAWGKYGA